MSLWTHSDGWWSLQMVKLGPVLMIREFTEMFRSQLEHLVGWSQCYSMYYLHTLSSSVQPDSSQHHYGGHLHLLSSKWIHTFIYVCCIFFDCNVMIRLTLWWVCCVVNEQGSGWLYLCSLVSSCSHFRPIPLSSSPSHPLLPHDSIMLSFSISPAVWHSQPANGDPVNSIVLCLVLTLQVTHTQRQCFMCVTVLCFSDLPPTPTYMPPISGLSLVPQGYPFLIIKLSLHISIIIKLSLRDLR